MHMLQPQPQLHLPHPPLKIPQRPKSMQPLRPTPLHHLIIALLITRDENNLCAEPRPRILQQLHRVGPAASLLRVPEDHALGLDVLLDEARDGGAEGAFLVGSDPDEEPVGGLDAGGERGADACAGADADAALEHCGGVADAGWGCVSERLLARREGHDLPNLSSRVQTVLGGFATRFLVKSPCTPQIM